MEKEIAYGVGKWVVDYLELPNYLFVRARGFMEGEKIYTSEEQYWRDLLGPSFSSSGLRRPRLLEGQVVVLRNFQLSEWFPRVPGLYWTGYGRKLRRNSEKNIKYSPVLGFHYWPHDKGRMILGGLGSVRTKEVDNLRLFAATTSGKIDAGIPVLFSKNVTGKVLSFTRKHPNIEVDLRGVIRKIPFTYQYGAPHVPKMVVYVNSILNLKKYVSDFQLSASAWTIYYSLRAKREKRFGYTYAHFNPVDDKSIIKATDWINDYISEYTKGNGIPISDYDQITPRFTTALLPLENVMAGNIDYPKLSEVLPIVDFRGQVQFNLGR